MSLFTIDSIISYFSVIIRIFGFNSLIMKLIINLYYSISASFLY